MSISIESLITSPTADQVQDDFESAIEDLGVPIKSWPSGGTGRTIVAVCAFMYAAYAAIVATVVRAAFLETSTGGWLTYVAYFVYGVTRIVATFATGNVNVTNGSASPLTRAIGTMQFLNPTTGKIYTNIAPVSIGTGITSSVAVQAVELGSASTSGPGAVSALQTAIAGVTVTNPSTIVGTDPESDDALKARCSAKLGTLSPNGPRDAYYYAATSAVRPDSSVVAINRVTVSPSSSTGVVNVYVASPAGTPPTLDLGYISDSIERYARPDSVTVNVIGATPVALTKTITIWCRRVSGLTDTAVIAAATTALTTAITTYPIGGIAKPPSVQGYLYSDFVAGTVKATNPNIFDIDLSDTSDLALAVGQIPVMSATFSVRFV